ncbi:hypothetical protein [Marinobacter sp. ELB17]|uniref:hypothetical protein n=1 Tax=Marinobacter sp. ELB17 TaxID=270374 RepID=UPI0000F39AC7|nr:hypothetical protein [Marinobacter sp. ELB17]EAZ98530.1 hypothetical protein MELB17_00315 [Marinobacter sp. ELB17]
MSENELIKKNHQRAQDIVNSWPSWKREFSKVHCSSNGKETNDQLVKVKKP